MGGAVSKRVKARRQKAAAAAALRCPRLKPLSFLLPCDATNIRGGDLLALVPDKDAARAVARELRIPDSSFQAIRRMWKKFPKIKVDHPEPKPSPDELLMDKKKVKKIEKKYRNAKRPLQRVALTAMWMKLFTGKGRFVKRTPLTDIVMSLFDEDTGFEKGQVSEPQFVALAWNVCCLNSYGVVDYLVGMFDLTHRNGLERCEVDTLVRMVYGVEEATDEFIPGIEAALKYFPSDSDVLIPKRALHTFVTKDIGKVLLAPVFHFQKVFRKRVSGNVSWELLGHGRQRHVRVCTLMLRDLECGHTTMSASQLRFRAHMVPAHFTQVRGSLSCADAVAKKARAKLQRGKASRSKYTPASGAHRGASSRGKLADEDEDDDEDVDALPPEFQDSGSEGDDEGSEDSDTDGGSDAGGDGGSGDGTEGDATGMASGSHHSGDAEGDDGALSGEDTKTVDRDNVGDEGSHEDGTPHSIGDPGDSVSPSERPGSGLRHADGDAKKAGTVGDEPDTPPGTPARQTEVAMVDVPSADYQPPSTAEVVEVLFSASAIAPRTPARPHSSVGKLKFPRVALPSRQRYVDQTNTELELTRAWARNNVVDIVAATMKARFLYHVPELEQRLKQHSERRKRKYVTRYQTRYNYVTASGETLMKDGEEISSDEETESDDSDATGVRGITKMHSLGSVHISDSDSDTTESDSSYDSDDGRSVRFYNQGRERMSQRSGSRRQRRMGRHASRLALIDPDSLEQAMRAASGLSKRLTNVKLPKWVAPRWGEGPEQEFLKAARRAAIAWSIVEHWRKEKRPVEFMVRMRRELASIRGELHEADMELEDGWDAQSSKDVERAEARAQHKAEEKVKMNIAVQAQLKEDASKMMYVHRKFEKVDPNRAKRLTKPEAMELLREEFVSKEILGAKDEVVRLYKQLRLQKRRLVRWLQDKAVELAHEDLARVQAAMMDTSRTHSARYSDEASYM